MKNESVPATISMSRYRSGGERRIVGQNGKWEAAFSILIFWLFSSIIPLYNKMVFNGIAGDAGFGFPATTTFLQLFFCAVVLTVVDIIKFFLTGETSSWIFGANLLYKIKTLSPIGIAFGLKYGVTNWVRYFMNKHLHLLFHRGFIFFRWHPIFFYRPRI